ncbi:MAG: response regulator transcription factor [Hyphomicrobium sp.]
MKALIIDDHPVVLKGCGDVLKMASVESVLLAPSLTEGVNLYRRHKPDVIVLDLKFRSEPLGGLYFLHWLRLHDRTTAVIVLTMHSEPGIVRRVIEARANAFVAKDGGADELFAALQKIRAGETYLSPRLAQDLAFNRVASDAFHDLTLRELETLRLIGSGTRYEAIADRLHVSYKTVVNTVAGLKRKLGADTLGELTRVAVTGARPTDRPFVTPNATNGGQQS